MKYKLLLWIFSFSCCAVCLNNSHQTSPVQTNGTGLFAKSPEKFSLALSTHSIVLQAEPKETKENSNITGTENSLLSNAELESSILFTGYDRGTNPSLLVVERWESSSVIDNFSYDPALTTLNNEKITEHKKLNVKDYSALLLGADTPGKGKQLNPANHSTTP